jgi:hypothetical protein
MRATAAPALRWFIDLEPFAAVLAREGDRHTALGLS